jgi:hypothetical protein
MPRNVAYEDLGISVWTDEPEGKPGLFGRIGRAIALPFAALAEAVRMRRALEDMARLDDRELADIGAPPELVARLRAVRPMPNAMMDIWR